ncbi:MAG: glycosyltransferase, partial [Candidatus Marinimicrobia bacterium]|nr:glycosyltransferase [Candidatus Neomarinimicrobiota bacterium]
MKTSESQPLVSIIIPHWNNYPILEECLESLKNISYQNCEIIVTDNASVDGSPKKIKQHFPEINLVENKTNVGYAGGCNRGSRGANGKYLLFL